MGKCKFSLFNRFLLFSHFATSFWFFYFLPPEGQDNFSLHPEFLSFVGKIGSSGSKICHKNGETEGIFVMHLF